MIRPQTVEKTPGVAEAEAADVAWPAAAARPKRSLASRWPLILAIVALVAAVAGGWLFLPGLVNGSKGDSVRFETVRRGSLSVIVTADGTMRSDSTLDIKSQLKGMTRILDIVPESTIVRAGDFLCQLDTSDLENQRDAQVIKVKQAEAAATQAERELEIQIAQNDSDNRKAAQLRDFAAMDLDKFRNGDRLQQEQKADNDIIIADEELKRAEDKYKWSKQLHDKGFISDTDLQADELAVTKCRLEAELARTSKKVLSEYTVKKQLIKLESDLAEAEAELKRTEDRSAAREAKARSELETKRESYALEKSQLDKLNEQIVAGRITAPQPGLVVYASTVRPRWGNQQPIDVGYQVRENESIISLPDLSLMVADVTVPEAKRTQIAAGQQAVIKVDAHPDHPIRGTVKSLGIMPAQQDWFRRGDAQQFQVVISVNNPPEWLLPGLRCTADIIVAELDDVMIVPVASVFTRDGQRFCYVTDGRSVRAVPVLVGLDDDKIVEVKAGLEVGWKVLLVEPEGAAKIPLEPPTFKVEPPPTAPPPATQPAGQSASRPPDSMPEELTPQMISRIIERIRETNPERAAQLEKMSLEEQRAALRRTRTGRETRGGDTGGDRQRRPRNGGGGPRPPG